MSNETARIRRIAFAMAVFRSIVTENVSGFTRKRRRQKNPDELVGRKQGCGMYGGFEVSITQLGVFT
jgi:hypothetical protein